MVSIAQSILANVTVLLLLIHTPHAQITLHSVEICVKITVENTIGNVFVIPQSINILHRVVLAETCMEIHVKALTMSLIMKNVQFVEIVKIGIAL